MTVEILNPAMQNDIIELFFHLRMALVLNRPTYCGSVTLSVNLAKVPVFYWHFSYKVCDND